ncbi:hypothetical protein [Streptomyces sp. HUAS TT20]|uniref:hypothetical protein n=1 Tax=Streptomyces sp. HUAS TT20 TaxID=3447509 RepID=UPI0021D90D20|nr:hypothetical protein [Streptomyces sp. HUAS 15-9]UXY33085.1 hypothetical protein N8I87_43035 [Streptomyces sp. HUAS 15-9]
MPSSHSVGRTLHRVRLRAVGAAATRIMWGMRDTPAPAPRRPPRLTLFAGRS